MPSVTIRGSWGNLIVDRATGAILAYDDGGSVTEPDEVGYRDILFVLPETIEAGRDDCLDAHGETDILAIGFVCARGIVTMPMARDADEEGLLFDPLLLPAPKERFAIRSGATGDSTGRRHAVRFDTYEAAELFADGHRRPGVWASVEELPQ